MTNSGSYDFRKLHRDADAEIQRLAAQARLGWDKEARCLSRFGLKDGMSLIEPGSGPGFVTEALLSLLPNSAITCVETDAALLKQAKQYLQNKASHRVRFVEGSVMDITLPDNGFDFAYARFLFQHLRDPIGAAREVWRVLKPGGKLVIYDVDDEVFGLIDPLVPEFAGVLEKYGQVQSAAGGNRRIGRRLWRMLKAAGFCNLDLEVVPVHSDSIGIEAFLPQLDPDRLLPLVQIGVMSEQDLDKVRVSVAKSFGSPDPYVLILFFMVCGEKPR